MPISPTASTSPAARSAISRSPKRSTWNSSPPDRTEQNRNMPVGEGRSSPTGRAMSDQPQAPQNAAKDPDDWVTGDESMTGPQASYLETLAREAGEEFDPNLSKAEASKKID